MIAESGGSQDDEEDAAQVFNIQTGFLVEALSMVAIGRVTPGDQDRQRISSGEDRSVGKPADITVKVGVANGKQAEWVGFIG